MTDQPATSASSPPPAAPSTTPDRQLVPIGYVWGQVLTPSSLVGEDKGNTLFAVGGQVDLEWRDGSSKLRPSVYVETYYSHDTKNIDWDNEFTIGVGAQVRYAPAAGVQFIAGAEYQRDQRPVTNRTHYGVQGFAGWDLRWPPTAGKIQAIQSEKRFWVVAQGNLQYPSSLREEDHDSGLGQGSVKFAYDLVSNPRKNFAVTAFQETDLKVDTRKIDHYNLVSPAIGIALRYFLTPTLPIELGVKGETETRFVTGKTRAGPVVYLSLVTWKW